MRIPFQLFSLISKLERLPFHCRSGIRWDGCATGFSFVDVKIKDYSLRAVAFFIFLDKHAFHVLFIYCGQAY
jgi:hypothetical protein